MEKKPYHYEDGRTSLVFSVRGPIPIQLGNLLSNHKIPLVINGN